MISRRRQPITTVLSSLLVLGLVAACAGAAASDGPAPASDGPAPASGTPAAAEPTEASPTAAPSPVEDGAIDPLVPTACLTLGAQDCERVRAMAASVLVDGDPTPSYVQVGPFGCAIVDPCPTTLAARPEGDVVIEFTPGEGINVHLMVALDGTFEAERGDPMGIAVEPTSATGIPSGPFEFSLGHCGVFSGIDFDGSWWDPVGPVPMDSGEAVNATTGVMTVADPNHAAFTTPTGFAVQLQRRDGPKLLPFCM